MTDSPNSRSEHDAVTTPAGITTTCPQCGVTLDALTTACARCGAVITGGGPSGERAERLRQRLQHQIGAAYQLNAVIGRGGMGIVFRAREVALDREVALKVLAFDPVMNPEAFTRFEREAKLAARLDHPNIVPIFAVGQGEGAAYYTMRFVRGGSLESRIAEHGGVALDEALKWLRDVASALDYAHAQGIVHRDIKPANILLSESGHAMVADFGIARAFSGETGATSSGSHTGVVGSPAYMAPEQWRGDKPDGRADQYALGVLAFELVTGQRPFRDVSMQELLRLHLDSDPPSVDSVRQGLPTRVSQAIRRAMAKNPEDRFASASAFVAALAGEAAVGAVPKAGGAARTARAVEPNAARHTQWVGYAIASVLVLTALAVGATEWRKSRLTQAQAAAQANAADTLAARLARELEETRKIAEDAQRRAERAEELQRKDAKAAVVAPAQKAHVSVAVRGGAPRLLIDGTETAASTPAIIELPPGRHIVKVEEVGRQYMPQQYVIDVSAGDTSKLVFADPRVREFVPNAGQGGDGPAVARFPRPRAGDTTAAAPRGGPSPAGFSPVDVTSPNPFYLPQRVWQNMSPSEQDMLRNRWAKMSPDQQRGAIKEILRRDSTGARFFRRPPAGGQAPGSASGQPQPPTPPVPQPAP